jgi:hypothetical protein
MWQETRRKKEGRERSKDREVEGEESGWVGDFGALATAGRQSTSVESEGWGSAQSKRRVLRSDGRRRSPWARLPIEVVEDLAEDPRQEFEGVNEGLVIEL